jgi:hypothetical protein
MGVAQMPPYDKTKIQGYLRKADRSRKKAVRGKAYEDLACYLFSCVPGITITARNVLNTFATEEIDVACFNVRDRAGLHSLNSHFIVECKGWREPVNSEQVAWFLMKIEHRGLDFGVLIAARGVTGVPEHLTAANFLVAFALGKKIKMVIITRAEIEALDSGEELAQRIIEKVTQLHATGGKCY